MDVEQLAVRLFGPWNNNKDALPWLCAIKQDGTTTTRTIRDLEGHGECYGGTAEFEAGRVSHAVIVDAPLLTWSDDGENLVVIKGEQRLPREDGSRILIRLNTECLKDLSLPSWRIVVETPAGKLHETKARTFKLCGFWKGCCHDFGESIGLKMNIACKGQVVQNGEHFDIYA